MAEYLIIEDYYITSDGKALMYGKYLPTWQTFKGESIDKNPFSALLPTLYLYGHALYITLRCFNSLSDNNKAIARDRVHGIVNYICTPTADTIYECFTNECENLFPDPCEGVVCDPTCHSYDLYETNCEDGMCIDGEIIEANNKEICGYDPCRDVVCDDKCYGVDKYSEVCEEGVCLPDRLLEPNSEDCEYYTPGDTFIDMMIDNKEILIIGTIVCAVVIGSIIPTGE